MPEHTTHCCSVCHQTGHNRRTCPMVTTKKVEPSVESVDGPIVSDSCPICMESIGKTNCVTTECRHMFCLTCFLTHCKTNNKCPMCRTEIEGAADEDWKSRYGDLENYTRYIESDNDNVTERIRQLSAENLALRQQVNQVLTYLDYVRPEQ